MQMDKTLKSCSQVIIYNIFNANIKRFFFLFLIKILCVNMKVSRILIKKNIFSYISLKKNILEIIINSHNYVYKINGLAIQCIFFISFLLFYAHVLLVKCEMKFSYKLRRIIC
jgi:hypothetical protein